MDNIGDVLHGMRRKELCFPQKKEAHGKNCGQRKGKIRFLCIDRARWEILLTVEKQEESEKSKNASEMLKKISAEVVRT